MKTRLTESEYQFMDVLWDAEEPMTINEVVEQCEDRTWKDSYKHILVQSLEKKKMIEVAGLKKTRKNYARVFKAALSREEYACMEVMGNYADGRVDRKRLLKMVTEMILEDADVEKVEPMIAAVEERRREIAKEGQ